MPLRESHFEIPLPECSRSSHLQCPGGLSGAIPLPCCCLSLLTALAAESPDPCTVLPLTFPLGIDLRITSFCCLFILSEHVRMYWLFLLMLSLGQSFARTLCAAISGLLGVFTAEMPGLQHSQLHIQAGSPGNPNQWSITCQSQWWMPAPLAVTVLDPGAWFPSMSWQRLSWSSVHLHTGSSVAHSQLVRTRRGRGAGQERPSAISALQLLPSFPYPVLPFPDFGNWKGA